MQTFSFEITNQFFEKELVTGYLKNLKKDEDDRGKTIYSYDIVFASNRPIYDNSDIEENPQLGDFDEYEMWQIEDYINEMLENDDPDFDPYDK